MVDILGIGIILGGLVLLLGGAVLSLYGVALLGALVGAGMGSLLGPIVGEAAGIDGTLAVAGGIIAGGLAGIVIAYVIIKWAIAIMALLVGAYFGTVTVAPELADVAWHLEVAIGLSIGVAAAALATVLTRTILIVITSLAGAMLASTSVTINGMREAAEALSVEPLTFDLMDPIFLGLFAVGVLFQLGILRFGIARNILGRLPGSNEVTDGKQRQEQDAL